MCLRRFAGLGQHRHEHDDLRGAPIRPTNRCVLQTTPFQRPGPEDLSEAIPVFFIGRNRLGHWVARGADGEIRRRCSGASRPPFALPEEARGRRDARRYFRRSASNWTWKTRAIRCWLASTSHECYESSAPPSSALLLMAVLAGNDRAEGRNIPVPPAITDARRSHPERDEAFTCRRFTLTIPPAASAVARIIAPKARVFPSRPLLLTQLLLTQP